MSGRKRRKRSAKRAPVRSASRVRNGDAQHTSARTQSHFGWWLAALFLVSLVVRLTHAVAVDRAPTGDFLLGDAESYHQWATRIASGEWIGDEVFYQAPLYPYFLGVLYATLGSDPWLVRVAQAVLGALACVFLALAGRRWFSPGAGILAGFLLSFYAPAIFFVGLVQKTTLALVLFCCLLWFLSRTLDPATRVGRVWLGTGIGLAATILARENALILIAPIALWLALGPAQQSPRARLRNGIAFALGLGLLLLPVALRNFHVGGSFHLTTSQLGPNLYIGNRPGADGTYRPLRSARGDPRFEREDAHALAEEMVGRSLSPKEVSSYYVSRVWDYVRSDPWDWLALMGRKSLLASSAVEVADTEDLTSHAEQSTLLEVSGRFWHFGVLLPLAAAGLVGTRREWRRIWLLYAMLLGYWFGVVLFYVFSRYRFPLVPLLILFASAGIVGLVESARSAKFRPLASAAAVVTVVAVVANWPLLDERPMRGVTQFNYGYGFQLEGNNELARRHYERALELMPRVPAVQFRLGSLDLDEGAIDSAIRRFRAALAADPEFYDAHNSLGHVHLLRGELAEAEAHFLEAVELIPNDPLGWNNLANIAFRRKEFDLAALRYRRSLELDPDNPLTHNNLGIVSAIQGDLPAAIAHFRDALALDPGYQEAKRNLERALDVT